MTNKALTLGKKIAICLSGMVGGVLSVLADLTQKSEASAILTIAGKLRTHLGIPYENPITAGLFIILAIALCFIFETKTKKRALYVGASILTIVMILIPYNPPPSLNTITPPALHTKTSPTKLEKKHTLASQTEAPEQMHPTAFAKVDVSLVTSRGEPIRANVIIATLIDASNYKIIARSRFDKISDFFFYQSPGKYILSVEVPGYKKEVRMINLLAGDKTQEKIILNHTWVPLVLQKLFEK